jgi:site-specific DNA-methyltransferase (adenine-specific)
MIELNKIYCESNIDTMARMPDNFIDLVVTSPPYDNLREYEGDIYTWQMFQTLVHELFRCVKPGGCVVWNVSDAVVNGSESGTSFKQALEFMDIGFRLHDTMIYKKNSSTYPAQKKSKRYSQIFEYVFIFSIGEPKTTNLICDKKNIWAGHKDFSGKLKNPVPEYSPRENIWEYTTSFNDNTEHPAVMPEGLAKDHIYSWSNEGDVVYDCFGGSGTTAKMAHLYKRDWILSEISSDYCKIAEKRLEPYLKQTQLL